MAENSNVIYIPYGQDEIDQAALNEALANEYQNYLNSRVWTRGKKGQKRAQKWIDFHNKVSHQGITGASIVDGQWGINYNGQDFTYADPDEKQIAEDYASFVIDQMKKLPTRKSKEDKKEDKKDKYDFRSNFKQDFLNRYYGNNPDLYKAEWFELDPRGEKGIRGTEERRKRLIEALTKYRDESLKDNYDYEGTPFTGYDDIKSRITEAINALQSPNANDDLPALNKLGLDYRSMMYDGANDVYGRDTNGNPVTYQQYYDNLDKIAKQEAEAKATSAKKAAETARANYWDGFKSYDFSKFHGRPLKSEESNIEHLSNLFAKDKWSGDEASQIVQAFKLAEQNGKLVPLSKEELSKLNPSIWKNRAKYLRKIDGVDGLYYDTYSRQYKKFYKNGQTSQTSFQDILNQNSPEALKEKQNKQAAVNMNTPISQMTEWSPEMKKEIEAIAWDAASILNPEAFTGSAMALYASHLRDEANPNRGTLEKWFDRGTAALGGIQGVGDLLVTGKLGYKLYQLGKSIGSVSKFAGILGAGFGAVGAFEAKDSIAKLANPDSLTPQDLENIAYGLMGLIGLKSFTKARNKQTIGKQANPTITEHNITIKDKNGKTHEVKVDEATAGEINSSYGYGKKKADVDSKTFNHAKVKEAVQKYNEGKNPTEKLELEGASIQSSSKFGRVTGKDAAKSKQVKNPNAPEYTPIGTKWYSPFGYMAQGNNKWGYYLGGGWQRKAWENAAPEHSSKGLWQRAKEFWNPEPKIKNETPTSRPSTETPYKPLIENSPLKPQPKGESSELFNIQRPIKEPKSTPNYGKKDLNEVQKSIENIRKFRESYGFDGTRKPMAKGFDGETIKEGSLSFEFGGEKITLKVSKSDLKGVDRKHANFNSHVVDIRNRIAQQIEEFSKKHSAEETSKLIEGSLKKGWLKQGGRLDKQRIQKYKEFIKK